MKGRVYYLEYTDGKDLHIIDFVLDRFQGRHLSDIAEKIPVMDWRSIEDIPRQIVLVEFFWEPYIGTPIKTPAASIYEGCPVTLRSSLLDLGITPGWGGYDIV